ncbi:PCI-domain-containing protein [Dendrothele bispora CBS 962.96]|uniref:Eukaryotic translation initiation factor 3 subunit M n=1 Tax=Dendrothele bispora (strain CBS 962.96) TaxID=1314807 RepID=A0A4S8MXU2_DENBC|nr:PCI-domain-containing protein [Dendrothele bispora CBS 962.96]
MSVTDSVSVFAEGTFQEQIQELVNYVVRTRSEEERAAFIRPFQDAMKKEDGKKSLDEDEERKKKVISMVLSEVKGFGDGNEKEIEGFFNLIYAHLFSLFPPNSPKAKQHLDALLRTISSAPSEQSFIKYRILSNLFNTIPRTSPLRLSVYNTLLSIAVSRDEIDTLSLNRADVEKWLKEWEISPEDKSAFLKNIVDAYAKLGQSATSYEYTLSYIRSLPPDSDAAHVASVDAIATSLRLPFIFNFDPLFKLDAVVALKDHELFSLLQVFLNDGLSEFTAWDQAHSGILAKYNLDKAQLEHKIRLLTLASLGFKHVGQNLPYSKIAETLQVDVSEVEKWVIDVIRTGLLSGKLSQTKQTLHIIRSTARAFEREQWEVLEKRLLAWKSGLSGVLEVVANARRQGGHVSSQAPVTTVGA